jgi:phosphoribosylanthranilate isomerase
MTSLEDALSVSALGADCIGFVVGEKKSEHVVDKELAKEITKMVPVPTLKTMIPTSDSIEQILEICDYVRPNILQIAFDYNSFPLQKIKLLRNELHERNIGLMRAIHVEGEDSVDHALKIQEWVDILILDTKIKETETPNLIGIAGKTHDWNMSKKIVEKVKKPVILAGGLTPENVVEAIKTVNPWGVDACSSLDVDPRVEGKKDLSKVKKFIETVRTYEKR